MFQGWSVIILEEKFKLLIHLKEKYPANLIVVTGELTIDLPGKIGKYATNQKTFNIASNRLTFNSCLLDDAIAQRLALRDLVHDPRLRLLPLRDGG